MAQAVDFFVSYTSADRAWAKWIAWQLQVRVTGSSSKRGTLNPEQRLRPGRRGRPRSVRLGPEPSPNIVMIGAGCTFFPTEPRLLVDAILVPVMASTSLTRNLTGARLGPSDQGFGQLLGMQTQRTGRRG